MHICNDACIWATGFCNVMWAYRSSAVLLPPLWGECSNALQAAMDCSAAAWGALFGTCNQTCGSSHSFKVHMSYALDTFIQGCSVVAGLHRYHRLQLSYLLLQFQNNVQLQLCVRTANMLLGLILFYPYVTRINIWCKLFQWLQVSYGIKMSKSTFSCKLSNNITLSSGSAWQICYAFSELLCMYLQAEQPPAYVQFHLWLEMQRGPSVQHGHRLPPVGLVTEHDKITVCEHNTIWHGFSFKETDHFDNSR